MHIALHDGFAGQTVTILVDRREVYRRGNVRTDLRISRADAFDTEAAGPSAEIAVTIAPGNYHATTRVDVAATPYVAIDLHGGTISFTPSAAPFRYL